MNKTIKGRTYSFGVLPPTLAIGVEVTIAKAIGEPLFKAFASVDKAANGTKEEKHKAMQEAAMVAMGLVASRVDPVELVSTMELVFKYVTCEGKRFEINSHFAGKNKELWEVFIEALRFNFSDFLDGSLFTSLQATVTAE